MCLVKFLTKNALSFCPFLYLQWAVNILPSAKNENNPIILALTGLCHLPVSLQFFSPAAHRTILFLFQLLCWKTIQCLIWRHCEKFAARKHNSDWVRSDNENGNGCSCQLITVCPELTNENQFLASMQVDWPSLCCPYTIKKFGEWGFLGEMGHTLVKGNDLAQKTLHLEHPDFWNKWKNPTRLLMPHFMLWWQSEKSLHN